MSIRTKIISCFLGVLLLLAGVAGYNFFRSSQSNNHLILVNELFLPLSRLVVHLQGNIQSLGENVERLRKRGGSNVRETSFSRMARDLYPYVVLKKFGAIEELIAKHKKSHFSPMIQELGVLIAEAKSKFERLVQSHDAKDFKYLYATLRSQLRSFAKRVDDECQKITLAAQNEGNENLILNLLMTMFVGLFGVFTILFTTRILKPLPDLIHSINKIADGDFNQKLKGGGSHKGEIARLARQFNRMVSALKERDEKIQKQQKKLLQSERLSAVGQLSAEIVHEIRNPLNSISLNIDWLRDELSGSDPECRRTLDSTAKEIERLNQITERYLVRARVKPKDDRRTGVHDLIDEILQFSREEDRTMGIEVKTAFDSKDIFVKSDRSKLKQAFWNVLKNAKEAMPHGGKIEVRTAVKDNISRIWFSDTGHGMNESTRLQSFKPFFTTKRNGTGIGLMLTKSIAEEAQGSVQCESRLGQGTTITFQFPV